MERFCEFLMMKLKRVPPKANFHYRQRINHLSAVNKLDAYAIVPSMAAGGLRSNMFSTQFIISPKYQADFQDFEQ